jgi:hypothetical protein
LAIGTAEAQADPCGGTGCRASLRPSPEQSREWTSPVLFTGGVTLSIQVYAGKTEIPLINIKHECVAIFTGEGLRVKATFCGRGPQRLHITYRADTRLTLHHRRE